MDVRAADALIMTAKVANLVAAAHDLARFANDVGRDLVALRFVDPRT
jgi:hypothetical protein